MKLLQKNYIKYGLLMTGSLVLCLALMEVTGQNDSFENKSPIFLIYQFILPAIIWYLGINEVKKAQKGKLTFKQGFMQGFNISVVFALTSPFIFMLYYLFINPEILHYVKTAYGMPTASNATIISIDMVAQVIAAVLFGSLYAAIISFFLKSKVK